MSNTLISRVSPSSALNHRQATIMKTVTMKTKTILAAALVSALAFTSARAADITPAETKAIAEEGFIYGLPIVMNYAVMYEYAVDKQLRPVQGAVQPDQQRSPRLHLQGHGHRHAQQRHAVFDAVAGPARRADRAVRARPWKRTRYYSVQLVRRQHFQLRLHRQPRHRQRSGRLPGRRPRLEGRDARRASRRCSAPPRSSRWRSIRTQLFNPDDMPNVVKVQAGYKAQPLSAYLKQPAPPAAPAIDFPKIDKEMVKTNFFEYLDFALQFAPAGPEEKEIRAKLARIGIGAGQDLRLQGPLAWSTKLEVGLGMKDGDEKVDEVPRQRGQRRSTAGRSARASATAPSINGDWLKRAAAAQGRHLRQRRRRGHVSHDPDDWPTASRSTAASTTTRSPSPPASSRR